MRDITLGDTVYFDFTTRAFGTGIPTALSGGSVAVLESNNNTPITANISVAVNRAGVTGLNQITIITSSGDGYEAGKSYSAYISAGNVGGVSVVGEVVAQFTIQSSAAAVDLANGTDGLGALKALIDTLTGYVDTEVAAIKAKTDNLPADPADASDIAASFSTVNSTLTTIAAYIDTEVAAILAAVDTEVAAIKAKTDNLPAAPAATGDCITAVGVRNAVGLASANLDTQISLLSTAAAVAALAAYVDTEVAAILAAVDTEVASILALATSIDAKTANLPASPAATGDCLTAAGVRSAVGLASANLDTQLGLVATASALSSLSTLATEIRKFLRNKRILNPATGVETLYDDDGSVLYTRNVFQDAAGTTPYADSGADRVERFT